MGAGCAETLDAMLALGANVYRYAGASDGAFNAASAGASAGASDGAKRQLQHCKAKMQVRVNPIHFIFQYACEQALP